MPRPAPNYLPTALRSQALKVWYGVLVVVFVWLALIILPPVLSAYGQTGISSPLYKFFGSICHQLPERSFHILEHQLAVCSRCFGVYFGLAIGSIVYPLWRRIDDIEPLPRFWLLASMVPIGVDWSLGVFGIWENNHASRFITGFILGIACATYILPALVEIVRNLRSSVSVQT